MLIRISLFIAIIAGLAAGAINFIQVKQKIDGVVAERDGEHQKYVKTDAELTTTKGTLVKTEKELTTTKETLASTQQERDKAVAEAGIQIKKATELSEKLAGAVTERDDARAQLAAYTSTGFTPPQIAGLGKQIRQAQERKKSSASPSRKPWMKSSGSKAKLLT
jgi:formate-dependent nitrite reductase cytochrome c552 subunit